MTNKNILWIASYPKSGNTWMRSILSALVYSDDGLFNFDLLPNIDQFDTVKNFKFVEKVNKDDFQNLNKLKIVSKYWQEAQQKLSSKKIIFLKTHSANYNYDSIKFLNINKTRGCIYLVRDPRDVAISYSKFIGTTYDETIQNMTQANRQIYDQKKNIGIILSRWDYHLASWLNINAPIIFIKYEDLLFKTKNVMDELVKFMKDDLNINLQIDDQKINNIIKTTSFDKLKKDEENKGFKESSKKSRFFRSGKSEQWKKILNKEQINIIETNFKEYMLKFGYL